jgi:DNA-binding MarR family transcriptional regulator
MAKRENKGHESAAIAHDMERLTRLVRASEHHDGLNPAQWEALRYLSRANRFSNSPGALTRYLGATKGTVSQTVKSLEAKGYLEKAPRSGKRGSISLTLTEKATAALAADPWARLSGDVASLRGKTRRRLAKGLSELLTTELRRSGGPQFGLCSECRYFREHGKETGSGDAHSCMLFDDKLSDTDVALICIEFQPAN